MAAAPAHSIKLVVIGDGAVGKVRLEIVSLHAKARAQRAGEVARSRGRNTDDFIFFLFFFVCFARLVRTWFLLALFWELDAEFNLGIFYLFLCFSSFSTIAVLLK